MNDRSSSATGGETRDRILDAAVRLFHEHGYAATGVATVLQAADVNSGSLYHFFPGKEALLVGVLEHHLKDLEPRVLDPARAMSPDPFGRIDALLDLYRRDLQMTGCRYGCPVGNLALEVSDSIPAARVLIEAYFGLWSGAVRGWLEEAGERLPRDLDRGALATHVLSAVQGGLMLARAAGDIGPYDGTVGHVRSLLDSLQDQARRRRQEEADTADDGAGLAPGPEDPEWRTW